MSNTSALHPAAQLSPGAKKALVRLALLDGMDPSTDGYAWCGPYGAVLVRKGFAVANGRDAMGFKCFAPTKLGKAEGQKLLGATAQSATRKPVLPADHSRHCQQEELTMTHDATSAAPVAFIRKRIFFSQPVMLICDGKCEKAWGINCRPKERLSADEDDVAYLSDAELDQAPADPGTYEGGHGKPSGPEHTNKWCARECERSEMCRQGEPLEMHDWSHRLYNQPFKHGDAAGAHKLRFDGYGKLIEAPALSVALLKTRIAAVLARFGGRVSASVLMLECFPPEQNPQAWRKLSEDGSAGCALAFKPAKALLRALRELGCVRISGVEGGIFAPDSLQLTAPGEPLIASETSARG